MARLLFMNIPLAIVTSIISHVMTASASSTHPVFKRGTGLTRGATAGLGIGIAIAGALIIVVAVLLVLHFRQRSNIIARQRKHDPEAFHREKHHSSATTTLNGDQNTHNRDIEMNEQKEMSVQANTLPRRQKSIKDHLMGPMYRDSRTDLMPVPQPAYTRRERAAQEKTDSELDEEFANRRNADNRDTVQSFSSRRATRLMMYM